LVLKVRLAPASVPTTAVLGAHVGGGVVRGTLDSFSQRPTATNMCTKHGVVGTDAGANLTFKHQRQRQLPELGLQQLVVEPGRRLHLLCRQQPGDTADRLGICPVTNTVLRTPAFIPPQVVSPGTTATAPIACSSSTPALKAPADGSRTSGPRSC